MRRALAIDENSFGPDHPAVARDLNNLAGLFRVTNRLAEAEPLMRRALAIDEKASGPEHPDVANSLNNLAQLLHDHQPACRGRAAHAQGFGDRREKPRRLIILLLRTSSSTWPCCCRPPTGSPRPSR